MFDSLYYYLSQPSKAVKERSRARGHIALPGARLGWLIEAITLQQREPPMTKFFSILIAAAVFAPAAYAALNQAAQIVA
jgi:hypothetical protein